MKKNIIKIVILTMFIILISMISSYAEVVKEEYEGDTSYGIKCIHNKGTKNAKDNDLKVDVENRSAFGINKSIITISSGNEDLYVTDNVHLDLVSLGPNNGLFFYYTKPEDNFKVTEGKMTINDLNSHHVRSGRNHTRINVGFVLEQTGTSKASCSFSDGMGEAYEIEFIIKDVKPMRI